VSASRRSLSSLLTGTQMVVVFVPDVARWLGSIEAALMLQQLTYSADENGDCWFGHADAEQILVGRRPFDTTRTRLEGMGVATVKRVGVPPRLQWHLDLDALDEKWAAHVADRASQSERGGQFEVSAEDTTNCPPRTNPPTHLEDEKKDRDEQNPQEPDLSEAAEDEAPIASTEANAAKRTGTDLAPPELDELTRARRLAQIAELKSKRHQGAGA